jgi:23S rRNA (guanosine2251-2'-O)-methyltransferase
MTEGSDPSPILGEIDRLAREAHVPVRLVSLRRLESVQGTDAPQGVVAFAEPLTAASLDELVLGWNEQTAAARADLGADSDLDDDEELVEADEDDDEGYFIELDAGDIDDRDDDFPVLIEFVDETDEPDDDEDLEIQPVAVESAAESGGENDLAETPDLPVDGAITALEAGTTATDAGTTATDAGDAPDAAAPVTAGDLDADAPSEVVEVPAAVAAVKRALEGSTAPLRGGSENAFLVLLEGVTDPQNLGAILRSAECAGVTGVAVPRHRSVHVTPAVTKAAAGAIEHLQMALLPGMPSALQDLERLGVMTVGLDERGTTSLYDLDLGDRPVALVLGSEGSGLSPLSRRRCEVLCRIPLGGAIPSLNVSAAAAVACFEVARQRKRGARKPT